MNTEADMASTAARRHVELAVGQLDEFPVGGRKVVEAEGLRYVIFNVGGTLYALRDQCPHEGAPISCGVVTGAMLPNRPGEDLVYGLEGEIVTCPWHRWKYSIKTGESIFGVDRRRVVTAPVKVDGDQVAVVVPRARARRTSSR